MDIYKQIAGRWASGVTIVTTSDTGQPVGSTVSAMIPLSLDPPQFAVSLDQASSTLAAIVAAKMFCINILAADQQGLCSRFSGPACHRFDTIGYRNGTLGAPILDGVAAHCECVLVDRFASGDHVILVGGLEDGAVGERPPLVYAQRQFWSLRP